VEFGDFLDRDREGRTPFGEEGDGSRAENGEDVGDVVGDGGGLENFSGVDDVTNEEVFADEVRHRNWNGGFQFNWVILLLSSSLGLDPTYIYIYIYIYF